MGEIPVYLFTVRGQFAHWRKWFTTTSALTYSFPPRTAVIGMIGAILGVQRAELAERFRASDTRTAVCPLKRIEKDNFPQKWRFLDPKTSKKQSHIKIGSWELTTFPDPFQMQLEVLRRPYYRIVFWHRDEALMKELRERLQQKRWVYPPCMGIMGFLADVEWEGEDIAEEIQVDRAEISSVLPLDERMAGAIDLSESETLLREERVPNEVFPNRTFRHLHLAYLSREAESLKARCAGGEISTFVLKQKKEQGVFFERS